MGGKHHRQASNVNPNLNTNWVGYPGTWTAYVALLAIFWCCLYAITEYDAGRCFTYLNIVHSVVTFYLFHWKKGSPVQADQGDYDSLTWWEQMDGEVQNTSNRKFFTSVPAALFLLAAHANEYRSNVVYVNFAAALPLIVAKFPGMHGVRIFGINSGPP